MLIRRWIEYLSNDINMQIGGNRGERVSNTRDMKLNYF